MITLSIVALNYLTLIFRCCWSWLTVLSASHPSMPFQRPSHKSDGWTFMKTSPRVNKISKGVRFSPFFFGHKRPLGKRLMLHHSPYQKVYINWHVHSSLTHNAGKQTPMLGVESFHITGSQGRFHREHMLSQRQHANMLYVLFVAIFSWQNTLRQTHVHTHVHKQTRTHTHNSIA